MVVRQTQKILHNNVKVEEGLVIIRKHAVCIRNHYASFDGMKY
jgi:hypothetical protein